MFESLTFLFYFIFVLFSGVRSDGPARVSLETFLEDVKGLLHLVHFQNVCDSCVIHSLARGLVE